MNIDLTEEEFSVLVGALSHRHDEAKKLIEYETDAEARAAYQETVTMLDGICRKLLMARYL
ncbi:hypothetical protein TR51_25465 [Kitasatospora griseola]|uniref:Uncharacterized protein n=1 Tax=Kitasatospora griseola TaxID=2064 RepID=A0A0D0PPK1_KITGR|nr:hypothetical protein [Kitasatospora griseola]KIQ62397.1 hypothetical protein TR51_25465 [Kitasatospora griseola]